MVWFNMSWFKKEPLLPTIEMRSLDTEEVHLFGELPHHYEDFDMEDEKGRWKPKMLAMKMSVSAALTKASTAVLKWLQGPVFDAQSFVKANYHPLAKCGELLVRGGSLDVWMSQLTNQLVEEKKKITPSLVGNPGAISGKDWVDTFINFASFVMKCAALHMKEGPARLIEWVGMTGLVLGTVGKIVVMHTRPPAKRWCEALGFAPPLFEGVNLCLRGMGFVAAKATTLSGRVDSASSIIVIVSAAMKLLPPARNPWKALLEERIAQVLPVAVEAPFNQLVLVLAYISLHCPRFRRPTPAPLAPGIPAPPPPLSVVRSGTSGGSISFKALVHGMVIKHRGKGKGKAENGDVKGDSWV